MQLKKATIMTLTALYAAGMGSAHASANSHSANISADSLLQLHASDAQLNHNRIVRQQPGMTLQQRPGSIGLNVHRSIAASSTKVPFEWEADINGEQTYIVQLTDAPVALYQGERHGFAATAVRAQKQFSRGASSANLHPQNPVVASYRSFLGNQQDGALNQISQVAPAAKVTRRFTMALNGMSMRLSQDEAAKVAELPGVKAVTRAKTYQLFTDVGPKHIGADQLWQGIGVPSSNTVFGEGIIAGILDTGINTDHPSFAAIAGDGYQHINPFGSGNFVGDCAIAEYASLCNDKLIGVRSYEVITDSYKDPGFQPEVPEWEVDYLRPPTGEDYNGHGSHTAATVAGNLLFDVPYKLPSLGVSGDGFDTDLVFPEVSGVAPRANIISYQVCFAGGSGDLYAGCPGDALLAAVEDAISDGVDVINFSIGGLESLPWHSALEMAFLAAREAGISVAASAGNWGTAGPSLIDHVSPWLTSVAASTHGREITATDGSLGSFTGEGAPAQIIGKGVTGDFTGTLVNAADFDDIEAGMPGDGMCLQPFADATFSADQIVLCKRGEIARVAKGTHVAAGGAGAVVLYNAVAYDDGQGGNSLNLNPFPIPGLHVDYYAGQELVSWLENSEVAPQATITASEVITQARDADVLANFSSRGPSRTNPDTMVPNVSAPGVNVFAAYADDMPFTQYPAPTDYAAISGTSMSGPHVAGAMALLSQAHPDWTPAQIQSALMTTALPGKSYDFSYPPQLVDASFYEMGSGVINVARAVKAGLLLDESGDNYRAANPAEGGDVTALNVPYLANSECAGSCTWMRTFTATETGSWQVTAEELQVDGTEFLELEVYPSEFTLAAGESQSIMVTAKIMDVESVFATSSSVEVFGKVHLTPDNAALPNQYLPVMARFAGDALPAIVSGDIHRDSGSMLTPALQTRQIAELGVKVSGLTAGTDYHYQLSKAVDYSFREPETLINNPGIAIEFFDVPEGTRRLVWEIKHEDKAVKSQLDIGMDLDEDGMVDWFDEAICYSFTDLNDYCAINDPRPGRYWAVIGNYKDVWGDAEDSKDNITMSLALVGSDDNSSLTVSGPSSTDGLTPYHLQMDWDLDAPELDQRYYGVVEVGNTPENIGNVGMMAVNLTYVGDDLAVAADRQQVGEGDTVEFAITMAPNLLGLERSVDLQMQLSDGLTLLPETLSIISNNNDLAGDAEIDGNRISLAATQIASNAITRSYSFSTSDNDPMCRIPVGDDPFYLDLFDVAGFEPSPEIFGPVNRMAWMSLSDFGLDAIPLYGNIEYMERDILQVSPGGFIQLDSLPLFWPAHYPMDADFFPDTVVGPLWRGDGVIEEPMHDYVNEETHGVTMATTTDRRYLIVEWDNMKQGPAFFINDNPDPDARYSFELFASTELNFAPGEHEFVFAYDKMVGDKGHLGSIGLHGYYGPRGTFGPAYGYLGESYAFNDVDERVAEGMVLCANYHGPEQSAIEVRFQAYSGANAVGQAQQLEVTSSYDGNSLTKVVQLASPSNLTMSPLSDMSVGENQAISFDVLLRDRDNSANGLMVEAEHINATIDGMTVTLTPEQDWHGDTTVTVTGYDLAFPNDAISQQFTLTVISDGQDPAPPTNPGSGSGEEPDDVSDDNSGDSGSVGIVALMLLMLLSWRRRQA
ncbi:S8 family serine peptidase [Ferrimonas senticii]|uniref:S8 family serine peptidase n=1 Tax=Ferrimonas senticii TaxID=394566 RepID=UPI00041BC3C1|nr:S8 family serine peptidase [Ferrimonas senticii]